MICLYVCGSLYCHVSNNSITLQCGVDIIIFTRPAAFVNVSSALDTHNITICVDSASCSLKAECVCRHHGVSQRTMLNETGRLTAKTGHIYRNHCLDSNQYYNLPEFKAATYGWCDSISAASLCTPYHTRCRG